MNFSEYNLLADSTQMIFLNSNAWSMLLVVGILFFSMILAHWLKKIVPFLRKSLVPSSVLGGIMVLIFTSIFKLITGDTFFNLEVLSIMFEQTTETGEVIKGTALSGTELLDVITYHCLGLGFVAMGLRRGKEEKLTKERVGEVIDTGVTTVSTYLIQVIIGLGITIIAAPIIKGLIEAAGVILALGYGQGTGQAMNWGIIYESDYGFIGGKDFGLAIAALGFLSASIGGVICLNVLKRKNLIKVADIKDKELNEENINKRPGMPKLTTSVAIIICTYAISYGLMYLLGNIVGEGLKSTIYGFNFLFGTLAALLVKSVLKFFRKRNILKQDYIDDELMNSIGGVAFDIMIVAGIAVIDLELIKEYWGLLLILGVLGAVVTFLFNWFVAKKLFKGYAYEQFFAMYGMLTGTASTGIILLRELDPKFETPASDNLVYQNLPAIILGFPILLLAKYAPQSRQTSIIVWFIVIALLIVLLLILFRRQIFRRKKKKE